MYIIPNWKTAKNFEKLSDSCVNFGGKLFYNYFLFNFFHGASPRGWRKPQLQILWDGITSDSFFEMSRQEKFKRIDRS